MLPLGGISRKKLENSRFVWECCGLYTENWGVDHTERKVERDGQDDGVKTVISGLL